MDDNNNNYDRLLVEAINSEIESVNIDTDHTNHLKSLQSILKSSIPQGNKEYIGYIISIVKKTVRQEDSLIRQLLYTALSAYHKDPINLGIMAPTSEGKS